VGLKARLKERNSPLLSIRDQGAFFLQPIKSRVERLIGFEIWGLWLKNYPSKS